MTNSAFRKCREVGLRKGSIVNPDVRPAPAGRAASVRTSNATACPVPRRRVPARVANPARSCPTAATHAATSPNPTPPHRSQAGGGPLSVAVVAKPGHWDRRDSVSLDSTSPGIRQLTEAGDDDSVLRRPYGTHHGTVSGTPPPRLPHREAHRNSPKQSGCFATVSLPTHSEQGSC